MSVSSFESLIDNLLASVPGYLPCSEPYQRKEISWCKSQVQSIFRNGQTFADHSLSMINIYYMDIAGYAKFIWRHMNHCVYYAAIRVYRFHSNLFAAKSNQYIKIHSSFTLRSLTMYHTPRFCSIIWPHVINRKLQKLGQK